MEMSNIDLSAVAVTGWDGNSATWADLPDPVVNDGKIYLVYGTVGGNYAGLWRATGGVWTYLGVPVGFNKDSLFNLVNTADNTKVMDFDVSGVTAGATRTLKMADYDVDLTQIDYKANQFPGICTTTPIDESNITIDYTTLELTLTPPVGGMCYYTDGSGTITKHIIDAPVVFPAFTDTEGLWYFYFDNTGTAVTSQTPWDDFNIIAPIYRIYWNTTLVGSAKAVRELVEYHQNDVPADVHQWMHKYGAVWYSGFDIKSNVLASGTPAVNGSQAVISLTSGKNLDDNLEYSVTNSVDAIAWNQDMGHLTPATLTALNSGVFNLTSVSAAGKLFSNAGTRFPFKWHSAADANVNRPEYYSTIGVATLVTNNYFFVSYVYALQDPRTGKAINIVMAPTEFSSITNARANTWTDIQNAFTLANDGEIRPLYKLIFEYRSSYNAGTKFTALREIVDYRKGQVTQTTAATGSLAASSVTFVATTTTTSTNVQSAIEEVASDSVPKIGLVLTEYADNAAAVAGGLSVGNFYRTADVVKIVHA